MRGHHTPKADVFGRYYCWHALKGDKVEGWSFIGYSERVVFSFCWRLTFPLKQPESCVYVIMEEERTAHRFFHDWSVLVTPRITLCLSITVVSLGTDPWVLRDFHWCWWRLLWYISPHVGSSTCPVITHIWAPHPVPVIILLSMLFHFGFLIG